jgi:hypothetical protein
MKTTSGQKSLPVTESGIAEIAVIARDREELLAAGF